MEDSDGEYSNSFPDDAPADSPSGLQGETQQCISRSDEPDDARHVAVVAKDLLDADTLARGLQAPQVSGHEDRDSALLDDDILTRELTEQEGRVSEDGGCSEYSDQPLESGKDDTESTWSCPEIDCKSVLSSDFELACV